MMGTQSNPRYGHYFVWGISLTLSIQRLCTISTGIVIEDDRDSCSDKAIEIPKLPAKMKVGYSEVYPKKYIQ